MKITGAKINPFLKSPPPEMIAVLVYGPDQGLVRERADALSRLVVDDPNDPFRAVEMTGAQLKADPVRLADEAAALSLTGGRRLVNIRAATDAVSPLVADYLKSPGGDALIVFEAGVLGPRSKLRQLFEKAKNAAALACYEDNTRSLGAVIQETLMGFGFSVSRDAQAFLIQHLGSDRGVTRSELEKLALYMGDAGSGGADGGSPRPKRVELADAMAAVGDTAATSLDGVVLAACSGEAPGLDRALDRAFTEGAQPVSLLRAAARHVMRLHRAAGHIDRGLSIDEAMKALRPPVIFTQADQFRGQLRKWNSGTLAKALEILTEAELECKTTGMPAEAVCARALMRLGQAARAGARGGQAAGATTRAGARNARR